MGIYAPPLSGNAQYATVATSQTTTSTSYTDLSTTGPAVTVNVGTSGCALVCISSVLQNALANDYADMSFAVSGATTVAAGSPYRIYSQSLGVNTPDEKTGYAMVVTGLTPGSNTFTAKYRAIVGGTATFAERQISVVPL